MNSADRRACACLQPSTFGASRCPKFPSPPPAGKSPDLIEHRVSCSTCAPRRCCSAALPATSFDLARLAVCRHRASSAPSHAGVAPSCWIGSPAAVRQWGGEINERGYPGHNPRRRCCLYFSRSFVPATGTKMEKSKCRRCIAGGRVIRGLRQRELSHRMRFFP